MARAPLQGRSPQEDPIGGTVTANKKLKSLVRAEMEIRGVKHIVAPNMLAAAGLIERRENKKTGKIEWMVVPALRLP